MFDNVRGVEKDRATVNRDGGAQSVAWNSRLLGSRQATLLYATHLTPLFAFHSFPFQISPFFLFFLSFTCFSFFTIYSPLRSSSPSPL